MASLTNWSNFQLAIRSGQDQTCRHLEDGEGTRPSYAVKSRSECVDRVKNERANALAKDKARDRCDNAQRSDRPSSGPDENST